MDVLGIGEGWFTADQILETGNDFTTMVQTSVGDSGGVDSKVDAIHEDVTGRQTGNTTSMKSD